MVGLVLVRFETTFEERGCADDAVETFVGRQRRTRPTREGDGGDDDGRGERNGAVDSSTGRGDGDESAR